jgi:hypothetical protein
VENLARSAAHLGGAHALWKLPTGDGRSHFAIIDRPDTSVDTLLADRLDSRDRTSYHEPVIAMASQQGSENTLFQYILAGGLVLVLVAFVVLGVLAYLGRWRSWYHTGIATSGPRLRFGPLFRGWSAAAWLMLGLMAAVDAVLDPIPTALMLSLGAVSIVCGAVSIVFLHPPVRLLPGWMREEERERRASGRARLRLFFSRQGQ